jgi:GH15 family glucan-1,4-alpha-glucosidase
MAALAVLMRVAAEAEIPQTKRKDNMIFQPIENYGLIGDLCTVALVGIDSSIDFMCFPEFDSPTVFAALLDPERGGSFAIRPLISEVRNKQMYAAESNVLITRFLSVAATAEVIDFMPLTASTQKRELVRIVRVIHGRIPFRLTCQPAFDYARSAHEVDQREDRVIFRPANNQCCAMSLRATVPLHSCSGCAVSTFTLHKGESAVFIFGELGQREQQPIDPDEVDRDLEATLGYWRASGAEGRLTKVGGATL